MDSLITFTQLTTFFISVLAITNPIGNLAIVIGITSKYSEQEQKKINKIASVAIIVILIISLWCGEAILSFFGINIADFQIAGGIVLILLGISMLNSKQESSNINHEVHSISQKNANKDLTSMAIVPVAIPIIAGPGALTTIIVATHNYSSIMDKGLLSIALVLLGLIIYSIFYFSNNISNFLGSCGANVATKIMGLIIMSMSVDMIISGITKTVIAIEKIN